MTEKPGIIVYSICKNESARIEKWLSAVSEADRIYLCDTGSDDDTAEKAAGFALSHNIPLQISEYPNPEQFRFDKARQFVLSQAEQDLSCFTWGVSLDVDEFPEAGWKEKLLDSIQNRPQCDSFCAKITSGDYSFCVTRIHKLNSGWHWQHACHEVLCNDNNRYEGNAPFTVTHKQDRNKKRDYLPLLILDAQENKKDARAWHYLGREYYYMERWQEAIDSLLLSCRYEHWDEQLGASYRFISRCYFRIGNIEKCKEYAMLAAAANRSKENLMNLAWCLDLMNRTDAKNFAEYALTNKHIATIYPPEPLDWEASAKRIIAAHSTT